MLQGPFKDVSLTSKYLLDYVMAFYVLDEPEYVSSPNPDGHVKSVVTIDFPYIPTLKCGGKTALSGLAYSSVEAEEEAAFAALLFIEQNFKTQVMDFNYSERKTAVNEENRLLAMLSKTLELAGSVKMMFGEVITAIEAQCRRFSFDPTMLFACPMSDGRTNAFNFCYTGLVEFDQFAANCYHACAPHFDVLNKLTWKLLVAKTNIPN